MSERPKPERPTPAKIPAPDSLPKLPQAAFNLEKRGLDVAGSDRRE